MLMITAIFASVAFTSSILLVFLCANWISTKREPSLCYSYLMAVSIVICLQMVELIIVAFEFHQTFPVLVCIVDPVTISLPFLIFGFLATSEGKTAPNNFKQIWPHLIPSTLLLLSYIPVWLLNSEDKLEYITNFYFLEGNSLVNITPDPNQFLFIFGMLSLFYWWKLFQLQRNTRHSNHIVARLNRRIKLFMLILAFITIVLGISGHRYSTVMLLSFLASIFSAYCCYFFMLSSRVTFKGVSNNTLKSTNYISTKAILDTSVKSDTDSTVMNQVYSLLENKMNEKIYRDNDLSLKRVADACGVSTHLASQTINECFGSNFYNWVNTYRISEFKTLLAKDNTINITKTAYQVGFNSKSTFYNAFKKLEGITPTEFRKTLADS